jgi:hypothetical protein
MHMMLQKLLVGKGGNGDLGEGTHRVCGRAAAKISQQPSSF